MSRAPVSDTRCSRASTQEQSEIAKLTDLDVRILEWRSDNEISGLTFFNWWILTWWMHPVGIEHFSLVCSQVDVRFVRDGEDSRIENERRSPRLEDSIELAQSLSRVSRLCSTPVHITELYLEARSGSILQSPEKNDTFLDTPFCLASSRPYTTSSRVKSKAWTRTPSLRSASLIGKNPGPVPASRIKSPC